MKISHRKLEWLRRDPGRVLRMTTGGSQNPTTALWRAIRTYHLEDRLTAHDQLEVDLARMRGPADVGDLLETYVDSYLAQGNTMFDVWHTANLEIGSHNVLGGRVDRLDLRLAGGYAAWLFDRRPNPRNWRGRLAMPLIQHEVASLLGVPSQEVSVGFYWIDEDEYDQYTYSPEQIDRAIAETLTLSALIAAHTGVSP